MFEAKPTKTPPSGCSGMHGHPVESPLSPNDYLATICDNLKEEYAICPSGNYTKFTNMYDEKFNCGENFANESASMKVYKTYKRGKRCGYIDVLGTGVKLLAYIPKILITRLTGNKKAVNKDDVYAHAFELADKIVKNGALTKFWTKNSGKIGVIFESTLKK